MKGKREKERETERLNKQCKKMNDDMMQRKGERERQRERERERKHRIHKHIKIRRIMEKPMPKSVGSGGARDEERERMRGKIALLITIGCFPAHADFSCVYIRTT